MRALGMVCGVGMWVACATDVSAQLPSRPIDRQIASCPAVFPVLEGERSIVVPTVAPQFAQVTPRLVADAPSSEWNGAKSLLRQKLAERDRLQKEISELRKSTNTPEQVLVRVKVLEIDCTRVSQAGVDLKLMGDAPQPVDLAPILRGEQACGSTTINNSTIVGVFEMLEKQQFAKTLATPNIVTMSGVPASLHVGGEIPVPPAEEGRAVTSKEYGTRLDVMATTLGDNRVRLAIHPRVAEVDNTQGILVGGQRVPAITLREVDSACELAFGESFLVSGLIQQRQVAESSWPMRKTEEFHEVALVVIATPELVR